MNELLVRVLVRALPGCAAALLLLSPAASETISAEAEGQRVLRLGKTERSAEKGKRKVGPAVRYLATRLRDIGIEEGTVLVPRETDSLARSFREGRVDLAFASPFPTLRLINEAGVEPILLAARHNLREYHSNIFVRQDSGITSLQDLKGKIIAFEDRGSTSEYFLPKLAILSGGLEMVELHGLNTPVPPDKVGYLFAGDELNITSWVYMKKVAAGALSSALWEEQESNPAAYRKEFSIIVETVNVPRMIVSVRAGLDTRLKARLREELLRAHLVEEGRAALSAYNINSFSELPTGILDPVQEMMKAFPEEKSP